MENKVRLVRLPSGNFAVRWIDEQTGREKQVFARTENYDKALEFAAKFQAEEAETKITKTSDLTWEQFRDRFDSERMPGMRKGSVSSYDGSFNVFERIMKPNKLKGIDTSTINLFRSKLYAEQLRDATIAKHLRVIKAGLRWAARAGMLETVPYFEMPKRGRGSKLMKGRPLENAEFENLLAAVPKFVRAEEVKSWEFFLRGLWWSGLRLNEAINLYWDRPDRIHLNFTGNCPSLRIPGELQKSSNDQICPLAPEFLRHLETVPPEDRHGQVFKVGLFKRIRPEDWKEKTSKLIVLFGKEAKIVVATDVRTGKQKFASAHDLRRSFGERWSSRVAPQVLKELMRHESISTTMDYYVGRNVEKLTAVLNAAIAN